MLLYRGLLSRHWFIIGESVTSVCGREREERGNTVWGFPFFRSNGGTTKSEKIKMRWTDFVPRNNSATALFLVPPRPASLVTITQTVLLCCKTANSPIVCNHEVFQQADSCPCGSSMVHLRRGRSQGSKSQSRKALPRA